jgi:hypothetical protein
MGGGQTNEEDIAAVTDVARAYYEGSIAGDEALLSRARRGPQQQLGRPCGGSMLFQSRVTRL